MLQPPFPRRGGLAATSSKIALDAHPAAGDDAPHEPPPFPQHHHRPRPHRLRHASRRRAAQNPTSSSSSVTTSATETSAPSATASSPRPTSTAWRAKARASPPSSPPPTSARPAARACSPAAIPSAPGLAWQVIQPDDTRGLPHSGDHHRRSAQARRLHDRPRRQVAPRPRCSPLAPNRPRASISSSACPAATT